MPERDATHDYDRRRRRSAECAHSYLSVEAKVRAIGKPDARSDEALQTLACLEFRGNARPTGIATEFGLGDIDGRVLPAGALVLISIRERRIEWAFTIRDV
jgi:hypothetical protein